VRALLIDDGRRPLGVIAMIDDVSERRRLEEIRRDFVANVSHELKTPMGALGLLAETLVSEPDPMSHSAWPTGSTPRRSGSAGSSTTSWTSHGSSPKRRRRASPSS